MTMTYGVQVGRKAAHSGMLDTLRIRQADYCLRGTEPMIQHSPDGSAAIQSTKRVESTYTVMWVTIRLASVIPLDSKKGSCRPSLPERAFAILRRKRDAK